LTSEHTERREGEVARYFESQPAPGSDDGERFEALCALIKKYEDEHYPMP
jgi:HTH-type transcriptional regulator/antitoxin HigA